MCAQNTLEAQGYWSISFFL